jgi:hypothetical protein
MRSKTHRGVCAMPTKEEAIRLWPDWRTSGDEKARVPWVDVILVAPDARKFSACSYLYRYNSGWLSFRKEEYLDYFCVRENGLSLVF